MKNQLKNLFAFGLGLIITIVAVEIILHFYNPFGFRQKGDNIVLPKNTQVKFKRNIKNGLDSIVVHTKNSLGFRGSEKPTNLDGWISIIAVGGSTTECYDISDGKDWVSLLGNKLTQDFEKIWINNAGIGGHSTFGHQILMDDYVSKLKPNYVLFLIGCNDVERDDLNYHDRRVLRKNTDWRAFLKNNSELINLVVNLKRYSKAKNRNLVPAFFDLKKLERLEKIDSLKLNQQLKEQGKYLIPFENRVQNLISTSIDNHIIPIFITQPTLVGEGIDEQTGLDLEKIKFCDNLGGKVYWEKLELYNDITRKVAKENNIFLIDLAIEMPKSTSLFFDCIHFTNEGSNVVSKIIYKKMKELLDIKKIN